MRNFLLSLLILISLIFSAFSCKKADHDANTDFYCKINGKAWSPYSNDFKRAEVEAHITNNYSQVIIQAFNTDTREHFGIAVSTPSVTVEPGKYIINSHRWLLGSYGAPGRDYITGNGYGGEVDITTIDRLNSRITGKFHFTAIDTIFKETIDVTDGTFNMKYVTY